MRIAPVPVGPLQANCYLLADETAREAVLVDPGDEGERLVGMLEDQGLELQAIWLTHAHLDHVAGIAAVKRLRDVPVHLHPADLPIYRAAAMQAQYFGIAIEQPDDPDRALADGDVLALGSLRFTVMHAPGHAPGHVVMHGHGVAFVGDCLFAGSVGRTDLPLSSGADLVRSLERITALPGDTTIYPGHGPPSTIDRERQDNPFLNGSIRIVGAG